MLLLLMMDVTIIQWFNHFTFSKALTVITVLGACAAAIMPYLDAGQFRFTLFLFLAVSLQLQNIGHKKQIADLSRNISSSSNPTLINQPIEKLPSTGTTP